jgi:hypothetical protein
VRTSTRRQSTPSPLIHHHTPPRSSLLPISCISVALGAGHGHGAVHIKHKRRAGRRLARDKEGVQEVLSGQVKVPVSATFLNALSASHRFSVISFLIGKAGLCPTSSTGSTLLRSPLHLHFHIPALRSGRSTPAPPAGPHSCISPAPSDPSSVS